MSVTEKSCHDPTSRREASGARTGRAPRRTPPSATGTTDYAALEGVFAAGLGGLIALTRRRETRWDPGDPA